VKPLLVQTNGMKIMCVEAY